MIDIHAGLIGVSIFILIVVVYKYIRYNYMVITSSAYDVEMLGIVLLSLLNACICIIIMKEQVDSVYLLAAVINYIGIFTLGAKITTARLNQIDME